MAPVNSRMGRNMDIQTKFGINITYEWNLDPIHYQTDKHPRFGKSNPEQIDAPFWREMVKFRAGYSVARDRYQDKEYQEPVWGFDRAGRSTNLLPDGRIIEIGGYQENSDDDPDFWIYNDIVVYDGRGNFQIYAYPRDVFPPIDYHTATWVDGWIYIIGNLGYLSERSVGKTPVYRLNCTTFEVEPVITTGECPGWISKHTAVVQDRQIHISGGQIEQDKPTLIDNQTEYIFDLNECCWYRGKNILMKEKYGYIDRTGKYIIPPQFGVANNFAEGLAAVCIDDKWGYIDPTGEYIISPQFDEAEKFSEGLAAVWIYGKWGYIDTNGQYVISPRFDRANNFSEGLAVVCIDGKWGYINPTGEYIIPPQFDWGENFSEGLAAVCIDDKWGYIDLTGADIISPQFDWTENFAEGLAVVRIDDKWGYIDPTGQYIIAPQFDEAENFSEGLATVCIDDKWGYIDPFGQYIISPQFDGTENFSAGLALVKIKVKYEWDLDPIHYQTDKHPRFGKSNPEAMDVPFWREMVKLGWGAYGARRQYQDTDYDWESRKPVWCFSRFGQSITPLPDGRVIAIAGEHEDYYDPDFWIYNDVVVYDEWGDFQIYGYPKDVFPPTDFHTATWVDGWIYIIGNIGYQDDRIVGKTPVYRLNCTTFEILHGRGYAIEPVITTGECPGWISRHRAVVRDRQIHISGGRVWTSEQDLIDERSEYILDLNECCWYRESSPGGNA
jgi:WG containing repeat